MAKNSKDPNLLSSLTAEEITDAIKKNSFPEKLVTFIKSPTTIDKLSQELDKIVDEKVLNDLAKLNFLVVKAIQENNYSTALLYLHHFAKIAIANKISSGFLNNILVNADLFFSIIRNTALAKSNLSKKSTSTPNDIQAAFEGLYFSLGTEKTDSPKLETPKPEPFTVTATARLPKAEKKHSPSSASPEQGTGSSLASQLEVVATASTRARDNAPAESSATKTLDQQYSAIKTQLDNSFDFFDGKLNRDKKLIGERLDKFFEQYKEVLRQEEPTVNPDFAAAQKELDGIGSAYLAMQGKKAMPGKIEADLLSFFSKQEKTLVKAKLTASCSSLEQYNTYVSSTIKEIRQGMQSPWLRSAAPHKQYKALYENAKFRHDTTNGQFTIEIPSADGRTTERLTQQFNRTSKRAETTLNINSSDNAILMAIDTYKRFSKVTVEDCDLDFALKLIEAAKMMGRELKLDPNLEKRFAAEAPDSEILKYYSELMNLSSKEVREQAKTKPYLGRPRVEALIKVIDETPKHNPLTPSS